MGNRSIFCLNEVTPTGLLDEGWPEESLSHDLKLGAFNPTPHPLGKEGEPEIEMINRTTLWSLHKLGSREGFWVGEHIHE